MAGCKGILTAVFFLLSALLIGVLVKFGDIPWGNESCHPQDVNCPDRWFSVSYLEARQKFRKAAQAAGAEHTAVPVTTDPSTGLELTIDFAVLRGSDPSKVLLHLSGVHGVEGYAGSAIQHKILMDTLEAKKSSSYSPPVPTVILVHAMNPSGMHSFRRFNHNNVDLNRNCLGKDQWVQALARPPNVAKYEDLKELMNPDFPPTLFNILFHAGKIPFLIVYHGFVTLKRALVSGQYHDPTGVYYGGTSLESNYLVLIDFLTPFVATTKEVVMVDVHTGLGPAGFDTLMVDDNAAYATTQAIIGSTHQNLPPVECVKCGEGGDAHAGYELQGGSTNSSLFFPGVEMATDITEEFGTIPGIFVATSVIYENAANNWARDTTVHERAARWSRNAFYVPEVQWKRDVLANGLRMFERTLKYLGGGAVTYANVGTEEDNQTNSETEKVVN